jgi:predicted nucleotidyltransferase
VQKINLPTQYQDDIDKAVRILKNGGCKDIFLFGSVSEGEFNKGSDIDLAIKGCPRGKFFHLLGKLLFELENSVDLVNLDNKDAFTNYLENSGELRRIA